MSSASGNDEFQLISSVKEGDKQAFADLFNLHKRTVYSLCLHMSKDVMEAENLTQHAFISAYLRLNGRKDKTSFSTWLHRIAANAAVTYLRKAGPDTASVDKSIWLTPSFQQQENTPGNHQPLGVIERIALLQAIEKLPPVCRTVFILHDVEGYQHHEVADVLGCSLDNSKAQLHAARMSIRNSLLHTKSMKDSDSVAPHHKPGLLALKVS